MIASMTGCGEAHFAEDGLTYSLEVRTFNNRYLKTTIKLPEGHQFLEEDIEKQIREVLSRGSVLYQLRVRDQRASAAYAINAAALQRYVDEVCRTRLPQGVVASVDLAALAALPGVCQPPDPDESARERQAEIVEQLTVEALAAVEQMRRREGLALRHDLLAHCEGIRGQLDIVARHASGVVNEYHERLKKRVAALVAEAKLDLEAETLTREVALFADRCDISEEIARLRSHLQQFAAACDTPDKVGRKLDFLTQELLREANTIGSKANDVRIVQAIVEIKSLIDRLKEQVQNVE